MEIYGYSERGVINSLLYEIKYHKNNNLILNLLQDIHFPNNKENLIESILSFKNSIKIEILIEHSFSDFGDADILILIDAKKKVSLFIEAKVKTYSQKNWDIKYIYNRFIQLCINNNSKVTSNLFFQLYSKQMLVDSLKQNISSIFNGVSFTIGSKSKRKIGNNKIVIKAVNKLKNYLDETYYVMLVPDNDQNVSNFFNNQIRNQIQPNINNWNVINWGFITWEEVERFCNIYKLQNTIDVFKYNKGQIY